METNIHFWSYLAHFFLEWEMFQTKVVEKIKTHILCPVTFSRKSYRLWDNVEIFCRVGQATDDDTARAHCMYGNEAYKHTHTHTVCNPYCSSTAAMVARTRLLVALYILYLLCYYWYFERFWKEIGVLFFKSVSDTRYSDVRGSLNGPS